MKARTGIKRAALQSLIGVVLLGSRLVEVQAQGFLGERHPLDRAVRGLEANYLRTGEAQLTLMPCHITE